MAQSFTAPDTLTGTELEAVSESDSAPRLNALDAIDTRLVELLERDGRLSYAEIGAAVDLTPGGARARVMRLQERGVIRVIGVTNPQAVGLGNAAALHIEIDGNIDVIADQISSIPGVRYLVLGSGKYSILVEAHASSPQELFSLINRNIRLVPGVKNLETFTYGSIHTHLPTFPVSSARNPR